jgi:Cysteine-rich secretory protein family
MRRATLCMMVGIGLAPVVANAQNVAEQYLLAAANQDRAAHGLGPVRLDSHLIQAALTHNYEMVRHHSISHQFSGEPDLAARAGAAGVHFSMVSENVAEAPNSAMIHDLWMNSAGHRANLLDPNVDSIGISVIHDSGEYFAVEDFARTVANLSLDQQESEVAALLVKSGVNPVAGLPEARETCQMETGYAGARKPWFVMRYTSANIHQLPDELTARLATGKYHQAAVGACAAAHQTPFTGYSVAVLLYP